jgi:tRNA threonylcarbamoyladenosine biosynthesis protein TsaE
MKEMITNNFQGTQKFGQELAREFLAERNLRKQAIIVALEGDLGAGKTTFVQGLAKGLGIKEQITSPTYVLMKKYKIPASDSLPVSRYFYHLDCYRIEKPWQISELGFEEIINNPENIIAIEWPERIAEILPEDKIAIKFEGINEDKRKITIE